MGVFDSSWLMAGFGVVTDVMLYLPKMPIMSCVTRKSTRMMSTEETTTAWGVARQGLRSAMSPGTMLDELPRALPPAAS